MWFRLSRTVAMREAYRNVKRIIRKCLFRCAGCGSDLFVCLYPFYRTECPDSVLTLPTGTACLAWGFYRAVLAFGGYGLPLTCGSGGETRRQGLAPAGGSRARHTRLRTACDDSAAASRRACRPLSEPSSHTPARLVPTYGRPHRVQGRPLWGRLPPARPACPARTAWSRSRPDRPARTGSVPVGPPGVLALRAWLPGRGAAAAVLTSPAPLAGSHRCSPVPGSPPHVSPRGPQAGRRASR
jgi:hypothetical protein